MKAPIRLPRVFCKRYGQIQAPQAVPRVWKIAYLLARLLRSNPTTDERRTQRGKEAARRGQNARCETACREAPTPPSMEAVRGTGRKRRRKSLPEARVTQAAVVSLPRTARKAGRVGDGASCRAVTRMRAEKVPARISPASGRGARPSGPAHASVSATNRRRFACPIVMPWIGSSIPSNSMDRTP
jgi:hypothetical protein